MNARASAGWRTGVRSPKARSTAGPVYRIHSRRHRIAPTRRPSGEKFREALAVSDECRVELLAGVSLGLVSLALLGLGRGRLVLLGHHLTCLSVDEHFLDARLPCHRKIE